LRDWQLSQKGLSLLDIKDRLCDLVATDPEVRFRFKALPDFLRSRGSGTGSTASLSTTEELLERKSRGSGLEIREYGRRDPFTLTMRHPSIPKSWH
jgi:hypothetical protein